MILRRSRVGEGTLLRVSGVIKLGESADFFVEALESCLEEETGPVLVDLSGIDEIDSTGLGELVAWLGRFESRRRKMVLIDPSPRILRLLEVSRLVELFEIYGTIDAALAATG